MESDWIIDLYHPRVLAAYTAWKEWQEQVQELWDLGSIERRVDQWEREDSLNS